MKIHVLNIDKRVKPRQQGFAYPHHNKDFGVEQDFLEFLMENTSLLAASPYEADWHYLPVYWTRWHLNHDYGKEGLEELQGYVDNAMIDDAKTFTVCQYDDGPLANVGRAVRFLASRKTKQGIDIPLLCNHHRRPWFTPKKRYRASFIGRLGTHALRNEMAAVLQNRQDVLIYDGNVGTRAFVKAMMQSYLALAPRGYGGSSFRFFEAMQLGVAPVLIGDIDTRPFQRFLPWGEASIYVENANDLVAAIDAKSYPDLLRMGERAATLFHRHLSYRAWCPYVLKELQEGPK